jgi:hypothetical protein
MQKVTLNTQKVKEEITKFLFSEPKGWEINY